MGAKNLSSRPRWEKSAESPLTFPPENGTIIPFNSVEGEGVAPFPVQRAAVWCKAVEEARAKGIPQLRQEQAIRPSKRRRNPPLSGFECLGSVPGSQVAPRMQIRPESEGSAAFFYAVTRFMRKG